MKPLVALLIFTLPIFAAGSPLKRATPCCLESLFRGGTIECTPSGVTRGTVLYAEGHFPKVKARLQSSLWKGKTFEDCGTFVNRWPAGIEAIRESITLGTSCFDGASCFVMEYPKGTPVFGGYRDELRQIAPGVWLGRCTVAATGEFRNWFLLTAK